jgi:hypothetical protein
MPTCCRCAAFDRMATTRMRPSHAGEAPAVGSPGVPAPRTAPRAARTAPRAVAARPRAGPPGGRGATVLPAGFGAPDPEAEQGEGIFSLWQGFFLVALAMGPIV